MTYKWATSLDWLLDYMTQANRKQYVRVIGRLLAALDEDTVQDLFQEEMNNDGYFEKEDSRVTSSTL